MSLVTKVLSGLHNGISQQSPDIRLDSQAALQENCHSSLTFGLMKRPNTELLQKILTSGLSSNIYFSTIIRSATDRFFLFIDDHPTLPVKIYTMDGTLCTVTYAVSTSYITAATDMAQDISAHTIADYTFIVNNKMVVTMDATVAPGNTKEAIVNIKEGVPDTRYWVTVDGIEASVSRGNSSDANSAKTDVIATALASAITSALGASYIVERKESAIRIKRVNGADFTFSLGDDWGNRAIAGGKGYVKNLLDLPNACWEGTVIEHRDPARNISSVFYEYFTDGGTASPIWRECPKPGINTTFDKATMPHGLIRTGATTFDFKQIAWDARKVGDNDSAPVPSFVGSTLNGMFILKSRLGFLSDENIITTKTGDLFNFWPSSASEVLDDDPIDISISCDDVNILRHAVAFQENLILMSDKTQFQMHSGDRPLTPESVKVDTTTRFEVDVLCKPVGVGPNLYFSVPRAQNSSIREYFVQPDTLVNDAYDVTAHCPEYIPTGVRQLQGNSNMDVLFALSPVDPNAIYVYNFRWEGADRVQSAWHRWVFDHAVKAIHSYGSYLYLVFEADAGEVTIEKINLEATFKHGSLPFRIHLDHLALITGTYSALADNTSFIPPILDGGDWAVIDPATGLDMGATMFTNLAQVGGNITGKPYYVGKKYTQRYRFSEWKIKTGEGKIAAITNRLQARTITLSYQDTGAFNVEITPFERETMVHEFSGSILGYSTLDTPPMLSGVEPVTIFGGSSNLQVEIVNDGHLPATFQTAAWEGMQVQRGRII